MKKLSSIATAAGDNAQPITVPQLVRRRKAAFYLGVCARTCRRYEQKGLLHAVHLSARNVAYRADELAALIANAGGGNV